MYIYKKNWGQNNNSVVSCNDTVSESVSKLIETAYDMTADEIRTGLDRPPDWVPNGDRNPRQQTKPGSTVGGREEGSCGEGQQTEGAMKKHSQLTCRPALVVNSERGSSGASFSCHSRNIIMLLRWLKGFTVEPWEGRKKNAFCWWNGFAELIHLYITTLTEHGRIARIIQLHSKPLTISLSNNSKHPS